MRDRALHRMERQRLAAGTDTWRQLAVAVDHILESA